MDQVRTGIGRFFLAARCVVVIHIVIMLSCWVRCPSLQAHSHRSELYAYTHTDHLLWPRRWGLIKEEIQHHLVSHQDYVVY
jgi:hypothetical protein